MRPRFERRAPVSLGDGGCEIFLGKLDHCLGPLLGQIFSAGSFARKLRAFVGELNHSEADTLRRRIGQRGNLPAVGQEIESFTGTVVRRERRFDRALQ